MMSGRLPSIATAGRWLAAVLTVLPLAVLWSTLEGLVASAIWIAIVAGSRFASRGEPGARRSQLDVALIAACSLGFFLGGLYWLPAAVVFAMSDRHDRGRTRADSPSRGGGGPLVAALGSLAAVAGILGVGSYLFLPLYTVAQTPPTAVGAQAASLQRSATGLEAGLGAGGGASLAIVVVLFLAVGAGAIAVSREQPIGRPVLALSGIVVAVVSLVGILTIGPFLLPGVVLTLITLWMALVRRAPSSSSQEA